jgi:hypothetical protein
VAYRSNRCARQRGRAQRVQDADRTKRLPMGRVRQRFGSPLANSGTLARSERLVSGQAARPWVVVATSMTIWILAGAPRRRDGLQEMQPANLRDPQALTSRQRSVRHLPIRHWPLRQYRPAKTLEQGPHRSVIVPSARADYLEQARVRQYPEPARRSRGFERRAPS